MARPTKVKEKMLRPTGTTKSQWERATSNAEAMFKQNTPVRSGTLQSAAKATVTQRSVTLSYDKSRAPYGCWVNNSPQNQNITGKTLNQIKRKLK
jgi:hypothetical protein